jgi:hypothetical protein
MATARRGRAGWRARPSRIRLLEPLRDRAQPPAFAIINAGDAPHLFVAEQGARSGRPRRTGPTPYLDISAETTGGDAASS